MGGASGPPETLPRFSLLPHLHEPRAVPTLVDVPEQMVGKLFICAANLAPRKMKFGTSEGMLLAAGGEGEVHLLLPDTDAKPGQRVH